MNLNKSDDKIHMHNQDASLKQALDLISLQLNSGRTVPDVLPGDPKEQVQLKEILEVIRTAQMHLHELSEGKLHSTIKMRGIFGGSLKNLQSNLKHLTWKTQMIAKGDFSQRVDFLYDFSEAFNSMVRDLDETKKALMIQTVELKEINESLYLSREQYKSLIIKSPISICILKNGYITHPNPSFVKLIKGDKSSDINGSPFIRFFNPGIFNEEFMSMDFFSKSVENPRKIEEELICLDGSKIVAEISGTEIIFENEPSILLFLNDITEKKRDEKRVLNSLEEKEILLREVYHRVKNNLHIVKSLLSMQARMVKDEESKRFFIESQNRVMSLALVHENLYKTDSLQRVNYGQYLTMISSHLFETYNLNTDKVGLEIISGEATISLKQAVPCSLIINELISNSLKYAFCDNPGKIRIKFNLSENSDYYILDYSDTGPGIRTDEIMKNQASLGMQLISGIIKQLNGKMVFENNCGAHYVITFPPDE